MSDCACVRQINLAMRVIFNMSKTVWERVTFGYYGYLSHYSRCNVTRMYMICPRKMQGVFLLVDMAVLEFITIQFC